MHELKSLQKMKLVLEHPEEDMIERGKNYITKNLIWDIVLDKVEIAYENSLSLSKTIIPKLYPDTNDLE